MSPLRATLIIACAALLSAGLVALVSRTPERVRQPGGPRHDTDSVAPTDPALGSDFDEADVARHGAYNGPQYLAFALGIVLEIVILVVLARGPLARAVDRVPLPGGWVGDALVASAVVTVAIALAMLPLRFVRGYAIGHAWGIYTQSFPGWLADQAKGLGIGLVIAGLGAIAFFAIVRAAPRTWWVWGWLVFTALSALLVFVWPVLIAPLFNRFTPLENESLERSIRATASDAGISIDRVLVADASRRTTAENAYVAGLGTTKQVVLYDTLLESRTEPQTLFVVAHELGHRAHNHVLQGVLLSSVGLFFGFLGLRWLATRDGLLAWAGAESLRDPRVLPLLLLFAVVAGLLVRPLESAVSRRHETTADRFAIEHTDDPDAAVSMFRSLAFSNLADLRPPKVVEVTLFSHPPIPARIDALLNLSKRSAIDSSG